MLRPRLLSFELAWTDAAFDAIFPSPEPTGTRPALVHGIKEMEPGRYLDGLLTTIPFEQAIGIRLTLWMIALAPLFTIWKLGTIASIDAKSRELVIDRLIASPIYVVRQLTVGLKAVATMLYGRSMAIRTQMKTPLRAATRPLVSLRLRKSPNATQDANATNLTNATGGNHDHAAE